MASPRYMDFLVKLAIVNARVNGGRAIDHMQSYTPLLRDRLMTKYIADNLKRLPDSEFLLNRVMSAVDDPWALKTLQELYLAQHAGEEFLDVELENEKGERIHISSFKGKVLVLDFWITGCRACVGLFQSTLKPLQEQFKKGGNVEFISISADQNREMWLKSLHTGKYTDENAQNLRIPTKDNPLLSKYKIQSYPSLLLIDENGKLLKSTGIPTEKEGLSNVIKESMDN
ncbi:thioredoxin family protein [Belliella sp. DSM 111904]|uniref:Thioredoxin family protein n=1 Tax=Belliella filtrata TaxID=2923435 RepID=A0ABS9V5R6_9BACT|nr:thioredoxin family protein [Belliella filtrata]MCH7411751.1 thioredoxin family protein [Belliella filtrata]